MKHIPNVLLLSVAILIACAGVQCLPPKAVTHEEIKDALVNFMHIVRSNTEKLERHENRERQLGSLLKQALSALEKRERAQEAVLDKILETQQSIELRMEKIENSLSQTDEVARGTYTVDTVPGQSMITQIETMIDRQMGNGNGDKLKEVESSVNSRLHTLASQVEKLQEDVSVANSRLELFLSKLGGGDSSKELTSLIEGNQRLMSTVAAQLDEARAERRDDDLNKARLAGMADKLDQLAQIANSVATNERALIDTVEDSHKSVESRLAELSSAYRELRQESKTIDNVQQMLVKTADDVMDTKRQVELGMYQIRSEVGDFSKSSQNNGDFNETLNTKFTGMTDDLITNQDKAVTTLSAKVESAISQVWRQIGIMHQQITTSALTLDNLHNETAQYGKDVENKMDAMSSKLETIESSIDLVQENNNFLLGRFSLFTHEFNETRNSLARTTEDLKNVFKRTELNDSRPGPHNIDSSPENNAVNKL